MNNIEKLRKAAQDFLDATEDMVEQAVTEPAIDHNTPEGWVIDLSDRYFINHSTGKVEPVYLPEKKIKFRFLGNLYKTEQEAKDALELLRLDAEIKRFVALHDKDTPLDWGDFGQMKCYFFWNCATNELRHLYHKECKAQGTLYMREQTKNKVLEHFTPEQLERWAKS